MISISVYTQLATLKRDVPISQPLIRYYGFKLGLLFRNHIDTHDHVPQTMNTLHNKRLYSANAQVTQHSNNIISHYIDINNYFNYMTLKSSVYLQGKIAG